jgi:MYXO-CTERM domain-containing protein
LPGASSTCQQGVCLLQNCLPGMGDCNFIPSDGCEADLQFSQENCGACGQACELPNAQSTCSNGLCLLTGCNEGYSDCNLFPDDGCEADILSDVTNCGACGIFCPEDHACNQGTCQFCLDNDGDSFKDAACGGEDCDDSNPDIRPGTLEDCDGIDQNCNGIIDEGAECVIIGSCGCSASAGESGELAILASLLVGFIFRRRSKN